MRMKRFLSGDEAFAEGVRLARPQVISAYPITPQTVVVERLSEMVEEGQLAAEYVHVESEHSALSCAIGASATGARTFTATSSQGLLYMAECLTYAAGGRFPIVMMNANRATALPWNIYGDQRDSLALMDHGWVQAYAQDNQEALDLALMAYAVAEDPEVRTPFMVNLDGFALTHTYESVDIPAQEQADAFLPPYDGAGNRFDFANPVNIGYSAGPEFNRYFKHSAHEGMLAAADAVERVEARFAKVFGRSYPGLIEAVDCDDADIVLVTLGSIAGLARERAAAPRAGRESGPGAHPLHAPVPGAPDRGRRGRHGHDQRVLRAAAGGQRRAGGELRGRPRRRRYLAGPDEGHVRGAFPDCRRAHRARGLPARGLFGRRLRGRRVREPLLRRQRRRP